MYSITLPLMQNIDGYIHNTWHTNVNTHKVELLVHWVETHLSKQINQLFDCHLKNIIYFNYHI